MKEEFNINEIVKVESIGVIKQQLDKVESFIDEKVKNIPETLKKIKEMSFLEQEDEKGDIKKYKQYLSNLQKQLEDKRKEIKKEINKPYEEFNDYYNSGVYKKLNEGITQLNEVINEIETLQKDEKELEIKEFAKQHIEDNNLDGIVSYESIGLNITLSASVKSLKDQVLEFIDKVVNDVKLIELEEYGDEILLEYKKSLDFSKSKLDVLTRHKQLEELQKKQEQDKQQEIQEEKVIEKVEEITTPKEIIEDEDLITVSFKVTGTKEQIKQIKNLIIELGVNYE